MEIFIAALDYPTDSARFAYLNQACGDEVFLRNRVEALLEAAEREESFLDAGLAGLAELTKLESMQIRDLLSSEMRSEKPPKAIGPYRIDRELGRGGFGQVYLGYDDVLKRPVAIKVPQQKFLPSAHSEAAALNEKEQKRQELGLKILAKDYLEEAHKLATLDHPNIAPVYACGCTDRFPCYIVSKYIEGMNLSARMKVSRFSPIESAQLIAKIADALHHAHQKGIYHRDIKPSNLFLDKNENPYVGDFGLALREEDIGTGQRSAGTPQYMSPEQARGEGHRVDGRTDIFSLGVVFYELLTGQRPFQGTTREIVLEQIKNTDPRPPRHFHDKIPQELERICLKALAKKNSDRYSLAKDLADDLQLFLQRGIPSPNRFTRQSEHDAVPPTAEQSPGFNAPGFGTKFTEQTPAGTTLAPTRDPQPKVLPRGLPKKHQTLIQQKMMQTAARTYVIRWGTALGVMLLAGTLAFKQWAYQVETRAEKITVAIQRIFTAEGPDVGVALDEISGPEYDPSHIVPLLKTRFDHATGREKTRLAYALAKFGQGDIPYFCSTIINSPPQEVENLVRALADHKPATGAQLKILSDQATLSSDWNHKARLAIIGLSLGDATTALQMCQIDNCPDPVQRTIFTDTLTNWRGNLATLLKPWKTTTVADLRSALACGLGGISREQLGENEFADAVNVLKDWFETAGDGVMHSSAGWALRKWGVDEPAQKSGSQLTSRQEWFVTPQKLTMIQIKPGMFVQVTQGDHNPSQSPNVTLEQAYFLSDREITCEQFQEFLLDPDCLEQDKPRDWKKRNFPVRSIVSVPVQQVNWIDAILFCNWLSYKEGLTPCYVPNARDQNPLAGNDWRRVSLGAGYRLPTELEWEYACRAGTKTQYSWGNDEGLLRNYAVIGVPTFEVTGGKRPNGWGLFDMHGNVKEWCQDRFDKAGEVEAEDPLEHAVFNTGVMRGGSYRETANVCRSDQRDQHVIQLRFVNCGFRVALRSPAQGLIQSQP